MQVTQEQYEELKNITEDVVKTIAAAQAGIKELQEYVPQLLAALKDLRPDQDQGQQIPDLSPIRPDYLV
jgi:hypothetical protein